MTPINQAVNEETTYTMYFGNPVFEPGKTQSTCRLGDKWETQLDVGDVIDIQATKGNGPAEADMALVTGIKYMPFGDLPGAWLRMEHDPDCRTRDGLAEEMKSIYGEDFNRQARCTMVLFRPHKADE